MRKIRWGVLGTANIARGATIPGMQRADNCRLYAVAGRSAEKAERFRREFGFEKAYGGYDALLADPQVEAVYIPLPNSLHAEWAIRAAEAGKHVLCEKPLAASEAEAMRMFDAAEKNGVFLMEAFAYLHSPLTVAIKAEIDSGVIGEVRYIENAFIGGDCDLSDIRMRRETLGGALYDLGCYCVSQIVWLMGEPDTVSAMAEYTPQGIDRMTAGALGYQNGARAVFTCGMVLDKVKGGRLDRLSVCGTQGMIRTDAQYNQSGRLCYRIERDDETVTKYVQTPNNYALEVAQLGRCISGGERPHVSREFSLTNARTMDRVLAAIGY